MRRFLTLSAAVVFWTGCTVVAQTPPPAGSPPPAGPGKPPTGTTQPGTTAAGTGQPKTTAPNSTQPGAGQPKTTAPSSTQPGTGQPRTTAPGSLLNQTKPASPYTTGSAYPFGIPNLPPFLQNPNVRSELSLSEQQFDQLNQSLNRLNADYTTKLEKSIAEVLTDRKQLDRYRQLELQYRGLGAFGDPALQHRLNLTQEQRRRIEELTDQVNRELQDINRVALTDRERAMSRYDAWQQGWRDQLGNIFTGPQRQTWSQLTGNAFSFPPDFGVTSPTTNAPPPPPDVPATKAPRPITPPPAPNSPR